MSLRDKININNVIKNTAIFLFFLFYFLSFLLKPVSNNDFWWHLATGKYIVESKSLPKNDPFSYTTTDTPTKRKSIILKGYWLAEVIFYKIYTLWDLKGIIILRSLLLILFMFFVFLNIKKKGSSAFLTLLLTTGVFYIAKGFTGERPQLFTFFIFSLVYYLLVEDPTHPQDPSDREDFRINRSKRIYLIPPLVMLLSNMHPGFIVCILIISIYLAGEGVNYFLKKRSDKLFRNLFIVWILSIILSMVNPNGPAEYVNIFSLGGHTKRIMEFMPTFSLYARKVDPISYPYIIFLFLSIIGLRYIKKIGLTHVLLLIVFSAMSFMSIRYLIFYMCVSAPIIAGLILNLKDERIFKNISGYLKRREIILNLISCIAGIYLVFNTIPSFAKYEFKEDTRFAFPKDAADFLKKHEIEGNMFNEYGFGGYLIWRLYPEKNVFIDGRMLEPELINEYNTIASASNRIKESWEDIIQKYNISYIVMPPLYPTGEMYPIVERLIESNDWALVYNDHLSLIFIKKGSKNDSLIKDFIKDKREGYNTIIIQASARAKIKGVNPYYLIALGKVFFKMGRIDDARKAFSIAYERDPKNPVVNEWMKRLGEGR